MLDITLASGRVIKDVPLPEPTPEQIAQAGGSKTKAALLALAQIIEQASAAPLSHDRCLHINALTPSPSQGVGRLP